MASGLRQSKNRSQQEDDFSVLQQTNPMSSQGSSNLASGSLYVPPERTQVHSDDDELSSSNRGPLSFGLGFLKGLGSSDKKSGAGQPPKKRGPKPDSKPALTRRQELNRQAQRTHRERKEGYIKSLEQEVMQLREVYTGTVNEKNAAVDENKKLKGILAMHGIPYDGPGGQGSVTASPFHATQGSSSDYGLSHGMTPQSGPSSHHGSTPNPMSNPDFYSDQQPLHSHHMHQHPHQQHHLQHPQEDLDYDQVGVDFVLALEAACLDHLQMMCVRSNQDPSPTPNGHAMMMSCPPFSHIDNNPDVPYPHKMPNVPKADLMKLLSLSQDLQLDGEITPIMALNIIRSHPRYYELSGADLESIKEELKAKTRCYGFGAVLEEFELRDALSNVFATKLESYSVFQ